MTPATNLTQCIHFNNSQWHYYLKGGWGGGMNIITIRVNTLCRISGTHPLLSVFFPLESLALYLDFSFPILSLYFFVNYLSTPRLGKGEEFRLQCQYSDCRCFRLPNYLLLMETRHFLVNIFPEVFTDVIEVNSIEKNGGWFLPCLMIPLCHAVGS